MLNKVEGELPSMSDLAKTDEIELQEITENAARNMENLIKQSEGQDTLPMWELQGLDKQFRSIRSSLKVEVAKRLSWRNTLRKKSISSRKFETIQNMTMAFEKTSEIGLLS